MKRFPKLNLKGSLSTRTFRMGGYSVAAGVILIAIAVAVNLLMGALPSSVTQLDNSQEQLLSLSEQTRQIAAEIDQDVQIYWIVQSGSEDSAIRALLDRYKDLSGRILVSKIDPDAYPTFAQKYSITTLYNNSLVVESDKRFRFISYSDIYLYDYNTSDIYSDDSNYTVSFNGESALTSAIDYVISDALPKLYNLTGHGEKTLAAAFTADIENENIELAELSLLTAGAVPDDADCLLINAPSSDISEKERDILIQYLQSGGKLLLITDPPQADRLVNLEAVAAEYGISAVDGVVVEGNPNYCLYNEAYWLLPGMTSHAITDALISGSYHVTLPVAQGLKISNELRDGLEVTPLLTTSGSAFSKLAGYALETYEKEEGDIEGPFHLAVAVSESLSDGSQTQIVWISSSAVNDVTANSYVSGANGDFFLNSLSWMCQSDGNKLSIRAKNLDVRYLTISSSASSLLTTLAVGVIPLAYLIFGIIIFIRRKRK